MTADVLDLAAARKGHTARLREASWEPKERLGKYIWAHPRTGFYYAQEMALEMEARSRSEGNGEEE